MMAVAIDILCTIVEIGLLFYIFKVYFGEEKCGKWLTFIFYFVLGCVMFFVSHMELALAPKMVCTFLIMLCPMFLYDNNWLAKVLVGTTLWAVQLSCEFFTWGFLSLITQNLHEPLVGHEIDNYIQGVFLSKSIAILVVYWIAAFKKQNKYYGHKKLLCAFMLLPMITTISLNQLAYATAFIQTKITHERFLLVALFMIGANALLFYLFDKQMDAERLRREYELLTLREKLQEDYYASLIQRDIEVSKINHDMKNHISFLRYQLEHNDIEIAKNYLYDLSRNMVFTKLCNTGNVAIDAILNIKHAEAAVDNIQLQVENPRPICIQGISDMELVVVLSNCLDNAIEATRDIYEQERIINVLLISDETGLTISMVNPIREIVDVEHLRSTKIGIGHGLGLKNVKSIAEKYGGILRLESTEHQFAVKLYIPSYSIISTKSA